MSSGATSELDRDHGAERCWKDLKATRVHIEGDRPMSVHWTFDVALPMELFRAFSVLRG